MVVPKSMREALGLVPGRRVDIVFADGRIVIEPAPIELELIDDDGLPALRAVDDDLPAPDPHIVRNTMEQVRAERDARHV